MSDGRLEIFGDFAAKWEPAAELGSSDHVAVDTTLPVDSTMERLRGRVPISKGPPA